MWKALQGSQIYRNAKPLWEQPSAWGAYVNPPKHHPRLWTKDPEQIWKYHLMFTPWELQFKVANSLEIIFFSESSRKSCRFRNTSDCLEPGTVQICRDTEPSLLARLWQRVWKSRMLLSLIQFLSKSSKNKQSHRWIRVGGRKDKSLPWEPVPAATGASQESAQIGQSYL